MLREKLDRELGMELGAHPGWLGMGTNSYLGQVRGDEAAPASHNSQRWDFWDFSQFFKSLTSAMPRPALPSDPTERQNEGRSPQILNFGRQLQPCQFLAGEWGGRDAADGWGWNPSRSSCSLCPFVCLRRRCRARSELMAGAPIPFSASHFSPFFFPK